MHCVKEVVTPRTWTIIQKNNECATRITHYSSRQSCDGVKVKNTLSRHVRIIQRVPEMFDRHRSLAKYCCLYGVKRPVAHWAFYPMEAVGVLPHPQLT